MGKPKRKNFQSFILRRFCKDLDWFLLVDCLPAKCLHSVPAIAPYPYLDIHTTFVAKNAKNESSPGFNNFLIML